jgi:anti-sigma factor RsiW
VSDRSLPGLAIDCAEVVELLTDYLEGALQEPVRAEIEAHLALCDGCDAYLAQMRSTIDLLGHVPVESLTEQFRNELLTAFRTIHTPRSRSRTSSATWSPTWPSCTATSPETTPS